MTVGGMFSAVPLNLIFHSNFHDSLRNVLYSSLEFDFSLELTGQFDSRNVLCSSLEFDFSLELPGQFAECSLQFLGI